MSTTYDLRMSHLRSLAVPDSREMIRATDGLVDSMLRACRWTSLAFPGVFRLEDAAFDFTAPEATVIGWHNVLDLQVKKEELLALLVQSGEFPEASPSEADWSFLMTGMNTYRGHGHPQITRKDISFYWPRDLGEALPRLIQWEAAGHLRIAEGFHGTDPGDRVIEMLGFMPG